jgi:hypothetical protein
MFFVYFRAKCLLIHKPKTPTYEGKENQVKKGKGLYLKKKQKFLAPFVQLCTKRQALTFSTDQEYIMAATI